MISAVCPAVPSPGVGGAAGRIIFSVSVIKSQARSAFVPSALNLPSFVIEPVLILMWAVTAMLVSLTALITSSYAFAARVLTGWVPAC